MWLLGHAVRNIAPLRCPHNVPAPDALGDSVHCDPRNLRGLTEVPDLSDPKPVDGSFGQKLPVTVTDVENNTVTVTDTSRILALDLYGTLSRTLIGLGMGDKIVGRTVSSTEKQLHNLPVVTENGHTLNVEAIAALKPTLVIADRSLGPVKPLISFASPGSRSSSSTPIAASTRPLTSSVRLRKQSASPPPVKPW